MWLVYVLKHTRTRQTYVGCTSDIRRRMLEHNNNQQTATRRVCGTWILVYAEMYQRKHAALARERGIKHHGRALQEIRKRISA